MKSILKISIITLIVSLVAVSCSKDDAAKVLSCLGEAAVTEIHHNTDSSDPMKVNFEAEYLGDYTVESVKWEFGDGSSGTGTTTSHTYATAGTYEMKVTVNLKEGKKTCSFTKDKSITIN